MSLRIHPGAVVDPGAELDDDVDVGPGCLIGPDVRIGPRTRLIGHVVVDRWTEIGSDCLIYPFAVLGTPGQDLSYKGEPTRLVIGDRCVIREHASMHRGTVRGRSETQVGAGGYFMAQSHVAHDCVVGSDVILGHGATLGGHVQLGDGVVTGGLCAIHQFTRVGRWAFVGGLVPLVEDLIPFGSAVGHYGRLGGLNLVGLKRRGYDKARLRRLWRAVQRLFTGEGDVFDVRLETVAAEYADDPDVMEVVAFIRSDRKRPLARLRD